MCEILIFSPHIPSNLFIFILQKCGAFDNNINRDLYKTKFAQNFNTFYVCCKICIKKNKEKNKSAFNSSVSNSMRVRSSNKRKFLFFKFQNWKKNHLIYKKNLHFPNLLRKNRVLVGLNFGFRNWNSELESNSYLFAKI